MVIKVLGSKVNITCTFIKLVTLSHYSRGDLIFLSLIFKKVKLIILWCLYLIMFILKIYYIMASKVNYFILFKSQSELRLFTFYNGEMVNELSGWVFYFQRLVIWKSWIISYPYSHVFISWWITTLRSYAWEWKVFNNNGGNMLLDTRWSVNA